MSLFHLKVILRRSPQSSLKTRQSHCWRHIWIVSSARLDLPWLLRVEPSSPSSKRNPRISLTWHQLLVKISSPWTLVIPEQACTTTCYLKKRLLICTYFYIRFLCWRLWHFTPAVSYTVGHQSFEEYPVCAKVSPMHPPATHPVPEGHNMPKLGGTFSIPQAPPASSATPSISSCSTVKSSLPKALLLGSLFI